MQAQETEKNSGLGAVARQVAEHTSSLFRLELELAQLELKKKVTNLGVGIGLAASPPWSSPSTASASCSRRSPRGLATAVSTWLAILIVTTAACSVVGAILALIAENRIEKGTPPIPEQAILEAKLTTEAFKSDGD